MSRLSDRGRHTALETDSMGVCVQWVSVRHQSTMQKNYKGFLLESTIATEIRYSSKTNDGLIAMLLPRETPLLVAS
jgi:hypothetical protein